MLASYDRAHNPAGTLRQLHAINASGDRSRALRVDPGPDGGHPRDRRSARAADLRPRLAREIPDASW